MNHAITMGIFWHLIGAASAACFYAPFKQVKQWSWETMWSIGGIVSWLILPWTISALLLPDFWAYYNSFSASTLLPVFLFGAMWGIGNINYGLTMRYLGMSMGIGIAIGITLIVGTLMTPILNGQFEVLINTKGGQMTLLGVLVAVIGVAIVTRAGQLKERKMGIKAADFNLKKGLVLAVMCGIFSAGMSFAMNAAKPMHEAAAALGVDPLYTALPSYVVIMGRRRAGEPRILLYSAGKSEKPVDKSGLLAGKTAHHRQYPAFRARRPDVVPAVLLLRMGPRQHSGTVRLHELDAAYELLRSVRWAGGAGAEGVEQRRTASGRRTQPWLRGDHYCRQYCRSGNGELNA
nr:L-rhamnose-proton symporter [Raoultella sp. NCTC 9187]